MTEKLSERLPPRFLYFTTFFHVGYSEDVWFMEEQGWLPIQIGQHVLGNNGDFYKVIDVWISFDHHGRLPEGIHVFMEETEFPLDEMTTSLQGYFGN